MSDPNLISYDVSTREFVFSDSSKIKVPSWIEISSRLRYDPNNRLTEEENPIVDGCYVLSFDHNGERRGEAVRLEYKNHRDVTKYATKRGIDDVIFRLAFRKTELDLGKNAEGVIVEESIPGLPETVRSIPFRQSRAFKNHLKALLS